MSHNIFATYASDVEWVVVQGTACVDANQDASCSADELAVPNVSVRSDNTLLAATDATGRFSVRVLTQAVIEFELPAGYESATGELSTQVFESGRIDVPLTKRITAIATVAAITATPIKLTATAIATKQNTPTSVPTSTPQPSATRVRLTATPIPPTEAPSTATTAPTMLPTAPPTAEATATTQVPTETSLPQATETVTPSVAIVLSDKLTVPAPTTQPAVSPTSINQPPSFEEEAQSSSQPTPQFSLGAIPRMYLVSAGGVLLGLALLIGLFTYRSNALKTSGLATASVARGYPTGSQAVVWEQGSSQPAAPLPSGREWQPIAQRLLGQARLRSISIDAEAGILAASTVPAPVFVLGGVDGYRLVFTIDPSLPVRSGLVADRSKVSRVAKFTGASRDDAHTLWKHVAQARNLANSAYPTWADWYLIVCQRTDKT